MNKINSIIENYPPEMKFLLLCCGNNKWNAADFKQKLNWEIFLKLVKRHRINPVVYEFTIKNTHLFPEDIKKQIQELQTLNSKRMLSLSAEMIRLNNLFDSKNITTIPIKGPALAFQIYNDPGKRNSLDLDFLIKPTDLETISGLMINEGYKQIKPDFKLSPKQSKVHKKIIHHYYFKNPNTNLLVEIHWKLITPSSLFTNSEKMFFESFITSNPFIKIKPELLLHYLIVHGSMHRWYKLFWLNDIQEIIQSNNNFDYNYFNKLTKYFGDERMVSQALCLIQIIFNCNIPKDFQTYNINKSIIKSALRAINTEEEKLHKRTFERIIRFNYIIKLKAGFKHFMSCLNAPMTNYLDWKTLPLPDYLFFLYYPLRPFLWFWSVYIKKVHSA
ncbi:MAG: nucleotidyltransferase family protein [Bacteroidia bacterium]|nr:nucleotidyltransferase family protein [Bacteroidia bacterium]